ncbi:hypothetical protein HDU77_011698, partial [Chytriomyces hyalinus]
MSKFVADESGSTGLSTLGSMKGGLQRRKPIGTSGSSHVFKAPEGKSALGLDRLAAEKRRERQVAERDSAPLKKVEQTKPEQRRDGGGLKRDRDGASRTASSWAAQTPSVHSGPSTGANSTSVGLRGSTASTGRFTAASNTDIAATPHDPTKDIDWEQEQLRLDRDWYMREEGGVAEESYAHEVYSEFEDYYKKKEEEMA